MGRGHLSHDFQAFLVDMAANQRVNEKSSMQCGICECWYILDLTGVNPNSRIIAHKSCYD